MWVGLENRWQALTGLIWWREGGVPLVVEQYFSAPLHVRVSCRILKQSLGSSHQDSD